MKYCLLFVLVCAAMFAFPASARDIPWAEALIRGAQSGIYKSAMGLPPFCATRENEVKYKGVNWAKKFGSATTWMNHYCYGKAKTPICNRYSGKARKECLTYLLGEYTYSIKHQSSHNPQFKLLPFLHTDYGRALVDVGQYTRALENFTIAIKKNGKYIPAFKGMADAYIKLNMYDEAEKIVRQGLQIKKSKSLDRRLKKIQKLKLEKK